MLFVKYYFYISCNVSYFLSFSIYKVKKMNYNNNNETEK